MTHNKIKNFVTKTNQCITIFETDFEGRYKALKNNIYKKYFLFLILFLLLVLYSRVDINNLVEHVIWWTKLSSGMF